MKTKTILAGGMIFAALFAMPSLGQTLPEMTPEIFAPGVISKDGIQTKLTMSADGAWILYCERDPATNAMTFITRPRAGESWGDPVFFPSPGNT